MYDNHISDESDRSLQNNVDPIYFGGTSTDEITAWLILYIDWIVVMLLIVQARPSRAQLPVPPLSSWQIVDLTQSLNPDIPLWPGDPTIEIQPWASYQEDGYFINRIAIGEHSGTHWGTPNTFIEGATSAEQVSIQKLVVSAIVMDIRQQSAQDPDYRLSRSDIAHRGWFRKPSTGVGIASPM
ncbi:MULTISPECIES: cyclase family protein [unclassified Leptolyngbya]|uniref:cyclase family protein n=1 Tax=unclassified Leptolyngbya TaxID=2650499 RepID=UPI0016882052|nr:MULTISPECIES: cyclase family protein [unclassified Leptolyngbya]MBD1909259.1 cyclase family protein [Leptolyngbya sp. FACHB-8]MBD2154255.1 cyclase family protein [Leptolyngbya sp. FACHB-16]